MIDEHGKLTTDGEVALITPSIGLSSKLLNRNHYEVYFADMPDYHHKRLRRHGDQIQKIAENCYRMLGRVDDTMNLGGIKISSAEIERVLNSLPEIKETAAIAVCSNKYGHKNHGPSQLVVYAVLNTQSTPQDPFPIQFKDQLKQKMQQAIKQQLNPLFKLHEVVIIPELPRTASNKIMRRILREKR